MDDAGNEETVNAVVDDAGNQETVDAVVDDARNEEQWMHPDNHMVSKHAQEP